MRCRVVLLLITTVLVLMPWSLSVQGSEIPAGQALPVPEFTHADNRDWLNSEPLSLRDLRGQVVLIDFWTFGCWNCYRSFPWLNAIEERLKARGFTVIGVHTPEFDHEKDRSRIHKKVGEFGLQHAVMVDNDKSYWKAMHNRYWPAYYLIDKQGRKRGVYFGETHSGDKQARAIEAHIEALLSE
jgi:thiol-disulfide isomerase/thioredoxin